MAFPESIIAASPADVDNPAAGAAQIRALKQFLEDLLGLTDSVNYTVGGITISTTGVVSFSVAPALTTLSASLPVFTNASKALVSQALCTNNFRLILSGGNLTLLPVNGNMIEINGASYFYTAMPTLAPGAFTPGTLYYIYAYDNTGTLTLEASITGYTVDTAGRANKTGDATRRLVGMARPIAGPAWVNSNAQAYVRTRDNRVPVALANVFAANRSTGSLTFVELSSSERVEFLVWSDESFTMHVTGSANNNAIGGETFCSIGLDNASPTDGGIELDNPTGLSGNLMAMGITTVLSGMADGYHYATVLGKVSAGTSTWQGSGSSGSRVALQGVIVPVS